MPLCPMATTNEGHVPGRPAATGDMSSRADHGKACPGPAATRDMSSRADHGGACPGPARRNEGHVQPCGPRKSMSRVCPPQRGTCPAPAARTGHNATMSNGHDQGGACPGLPAATRDMSSRADHGRACPGAACTIYPSNQDSKKVAAKLGIVETACAENTVSHWTFQRPGHPTTPLVMTVGPDSRRSPGRRLRQTPYSRT